MSRESTKKKNKKIFIYAIVLFVLLATLSFLFLNKYFKIKEEEKIVIEHENLINEINASYNKYVLTNKETNLYDKNGKTVGKVSSGIYLELEDISDNYTSELFKLKNTDMYVKYSDISKTEEKKYSNRYKKYIPFNQSVVINKNTKIYEDDNKYYVLDKEMELPIIRKNKDKYYIDFDNKLLYVKTDDAQIIEKKNSEELIAEAIAALNYHFVISKEERSLCEPSSICHDEEQFDSHMKYINENDFFSITMQELELFIDGEINLPKKSVAVTIDDGWFVARAIPILEKNNVMATLFLIGSLAPVSDYYSPNLEVHSHTFNLHNVSNCSGGRSALLCYDTETIVADLMKSRESLNNTTYFCYPFYEYNNHAIEALKKAGFTMALTGGEKKVTRGIDKFKVPRYVIYNTTSTNGLASIIC